MGRSRTVSWIVGAVVVGLLIVAGAWLLVISPTLEAASETQDRVSAEEERIALLEAQLAALRRDFENIDVMRAELAELRVSIPAEEQLAELTRQVETLATDNDVFVAAVAAALPVPLGPAPGAEPEPAPAPTEEGGAAEGDQAAANPGGTATPEPSGPVLYAIAVDITVVGDYADTVAFIEALQVENPRLVVVTGLGLVSLEEAGAQSGRPEILDGFIETLVRTYVYVVPGADLPPTDDPEEPPEAPSIPEPGTPRNPFERPKS